MAGIRKHICDLIKRGCQQAISFTTRAPHRIFLLCSAINVIHIGQFIICQQHPGNFYYRVLKLRRDFEGTLHNKYKLERGLIVGRVNTNKADRIIFIGNVVFILMFALLIFC